LFVGLHALQFRPRLRIGLGTQRGQLRKLGEKLSRMT